MIRTTATQTRYQSGVKTSLLSLWWLPLLAVCYVIMGITSGDVGVFLICGALVIIPGSALLIWTVKHDSGNWCQITIDDSTVAGGTLAYQVGKTSFVIPRTRCISGYFATSTPPRVVIVGPGGHMEAQLMLPDAANLVEITQTFDRAQIPLAAPLPRRQP